MMVFHLFSFVTCETVWCASNTTNLYFNEILCCIRCKPDEERILDVFPRETELVTLVKMGSRAGSTHTH